jgi:hypothetical protein
MNTEQIEASSKKVRRRAHPEHNVSTALAEHLRLRARPGVWWSAIANNPRSAVAGAFGKAAGCRAGLPDFFLARAGRLHALELKVPSGRLSTVQRRMHNEMRAAGIEVATAVGIDAAIAQLQQWRLLR